ncbi:hypothetical protein GH714_038950 [Hevea brasiliensis]|uniref:Uncharacterized protein n=1 Tax=Hevea brasiliensis TaxID=3981 RepID=A0A6A6K9V4_HEVBR|nr:hypothetical protein GH714_038950 [Hevea brasiliensis]
MKNTVKSSKTNANSKSDVRKDRKSATGMSGSPKKGGHGGKFTWAGDGCFDWLAVISWFDPYLWDWDSSKLIVENTES